MAKTTLMAELERLVSEARNPETMQIDLMTSSEIVAAMNKQDAGVAEAVKKIMTRSLVRRAQAIVNKTRNANRRITRA